MDANHRVNSNASNKAEFNRYVAKTKSEMAFEMGICLKTFQRKLRKNGLDVPRGLISPQLQSLIYEKLSW